MKLATVALVLSLAAVALGQDEESVAREFQRLAVAADPTDDAWLARLREVIGDRWDEEVLGSTSIAARSTRIERARVALVRGLSTGDVDRLIGAAMAGDERAARLEVLMSNLRGRPAIGAAFMRNGAAAALIGPPHNDQIWIELCAAVAGEDLIAGDSSFAVWLLGQEKAAARTAAELADLEGAVGLGLVADVLSGTITVPSAARAALAAFDPNVVNDLHETRPLDPATREGLARVAESDVDPALRVAACRALHLSADGEGARDAWRAYAAATSHRIDRDEWFYAGANIGLPPEDLEVPDPMLAAALSGRLQVWHVRAWDDPEGAEADAAIVRRMLARTTAAHRRAALLLALDGHTFNFVHGPAGSVAVPSFLGLIDDLSRVPHESRELTRLQARLAARWQRGLDRGSAPGPLDGSVVSRVRALVPDRPMTEEEWSRIGASVAEWLRQDPAHLYDEEIRRRLVARTGNGLRDVLSAYPEETVRNLLRTPPEVLRTQRFGEIRDPSGSSARRPLLRLLAVDPRHVARLADPELVLAWPEAERRDVGASLRRLAPNESTERFRGVLADDHVAAGFIEEAFAEPLDPPWEPEDAALQLAARIVAGVVPRERVLDLLVDGGSVPDRLDFACGLVLPDDVRARLVGVLRDHVDPRLAWFAAALLTATDRADAFDAVLAHGERLWATSHRSTPPLADVGGLVHDISTLEAVLRYVENTEAHPRGRVFAFANAAPLERFAYDPTDSAARERCADAHERIARWIETRAASLDLDTAEGVLDLWRRAPVDVFDDTIREAKAARARESARAAIDALLEGGVKARLNGAMEDLPPR